MEEAAVAELAELLAVPAAREAAAEVALALSGSAEGRKLLLEGPPGVLEALLELGTTPWPPAACCAAGGHVNPSAGRQGRGGQVNPSTGGQGVLGGQVNPTVGGQVNPALSCLVNLSSEPAARERLLAALPALLRLLPAGPACGVLANLCRDREAAQRVLQGLEENGSGLESLLGALREPRPPPELGSLLCNLSQIPEGRRGILDRSRRSVQRLLPHTQFPAVLELRRGLIGALRNCCFQYEAHEWLLSEEVDVLPFLLLPLAGPEEFPEDEMEQLPVDLQYLPPEKQREEEPDIRKMLLETIMLLSATAVGRGVLRAKGTFPVLRELHRSEQEPRVLAACQKLIQVLIGDDPPPGMENLLTVEVPAEVELQLQRLDREEEEEEERRWEEAQRGDGAHGEDLGPPRGGMSSTSPQRLNISSDGDSTTSSTS
ncbi:protein HGH1 homolog isoform X5 [Cuculus canorus]|uniref:protein HGH1 homolog isoform X5 n=1 Tax=Cuculus canorus TaxID=55661 RepID=UPI0023AA330A|nr:protein HGH1 homolog isoform X5 [Cuculus canorus]